MRKDTLGFMTIQLFKSKTLEPRNFQFAFILKLTFVLLISFASYEFDYLGPQVFEP